jgi:hypothetical protein
MLDVGEEVRVDKRVASYRLDDATVVRFEFDPPEGYRSSGPDHVAGRIRDAVGPAVEAAREVLDKVTESQPDWVELKFGVKVSGTSNWVVSRTAGEGNFEVTLSWHPKNGDGTPVEDDDLTDPGLASIELANPVLEDPELPG